MVHGYMRAEVDRVGNHRFQFLRYTREDGGKYKMMQATMDVPQMKDTLSAMDKYVKEVMDLFEWMYREKKLEPMPTEL